MSKIDAETRSYIMASIGSVDTGPEMALRTALTKLGAKYRLHDKRLPGTPNIVMKRYKLAIFVNECFSHGCPEHFKLPYTERDDWENKINRNRAQDMRNYNSLRRLGWRTIVIWEHEIREAPMIAAEKVMQKVLGCVAV